jgi:hypothetical protein
VRRSLKPADWLPLAVLALAFAIVSPALRSGWTGDDAFYSALNGVLGADRVTLWQAMHHSFDAWFFTYGRFYPGLILEKYLVFSVFTDLVAYKVLLVVATLITLDMFRRCVQAYTTPAFGVLAALMAAVLFMQHGLQDALLAYNAMPQFVAIATMGSLLAFRKALVEHSKPMAVLAFVLYAIAALTYEDVYALCVLYPLLARTTGGTWRMAIRSAIPQIALAASLTILELAMRGWVRVPPDALYAANLAVPNVAATALYQITAALPFAYWLVEPLRAFSLSPAFLAIFAGVGFTCWVALRQIRVESNGRSPFGIAIALIVLPALPVALVVKYQHELRFGLGYLPLFFQSFGVALLMAGGAKLAVRSRFRSAWCVAIALLVAALGSMTYASNVQLVKSGRPSRMARAELQRQISTGLLSPVPQNGVVSTPKAFDWIAYDDQGPDGISTRGLFYMFGRRRIDLEPPGDARAGFTLGYDSRTSSWSLRRLRARVASGTPQRCNTSGILNGDFDHGFRCWALVGDARFRIEAAGACLPAAQTGNPLASIDVSGNAETYIAQAFVYRGATTVAFRAWRTDDHPVSVTVGIVFPVAMGAGTEKVLGRFVPPAIMSHSVTCSGRRPVTKSYTFLGFARGDEIQLRLHAVATRTDSGTVHFDDVTSSP